MPHRNAPSAHAQSGIFKWSAWDSRELLSTVRFFSLNLSGSLRDRIHDEMWRNLVAEHDAAHLARYLQDRRDLGQRFRAFEEIWLRDELNHYQGLLILYSTIYKQDSAAVDRRVKDRRPDFTRIGDLLQNEFSICVCFAYDELASARGYAEAFPLYDGLQAPEISRWIRLAARDEMYHSINAQRLLKTCHGMRMSEVPEVLRLVVSRESASTSDYKATFLFDHGESEGDNPFSQSFLRKCANDVCKYLQAPAAFA